MLVICRHLGPVCLRKHFAVTEQLRWNPVLFRGVVHQIVTAKSPKAMKRAQSTRTLTFPQHLKRTCHKLIRMRRVRRRVEQHKLSLLRSTGTLDISVCFKFSLFVLTCGHLTGDVPSGRQEKQESQGSGEKCIHVPQRGRALSLKTVSPLSSSKSFVFFSPACFSVLSSVFNLPSWRFWACLLFLLPWWVQPPHSRLSAGFLVSLPTGARGHYTLFHAEWGSASDREAEREGGREGARAHGRLGVTSRGRSD